MTAIGRVSDVVRYPVKSMAGISAQSATLGLHGIAGDRRFAFRRTSDTSGFPFLTAGRFPALLTYQPIGTSEINGEPVPTHVRTPSGSDVELRSEELRGEITRGSGHEVELMMLRNGIFDDGQVSVISLATIAAIGREAGMELDRRRMRANVVLETDSLDLFLEDHWVGATMLFGDEDEAPAIAITSRDERCAMVNIDPDTGQQDARVMKAVVRMNGNYAGVYGTVVRAGAIHIGQTVRLVR
jgi:MOSC domain-containing protein